MIKNRPYLWRFCILQHVDFTDGRSLTALSVFQLDVKAQRNQAPPLLKYTSIVRPCDARGEQAREDKVKGHFVTLERLICAVR
ncbi:hypothetical protein ATY37_05020 [Vibrio cidicii]|uniref:Uncharacterized protein n=1 Tax=Vibrio cidicii TaxID=1763883 RepID=A0A151KUE7_9VIBR|nr:hypothetical protein ATY37_05020 [Vibrio cidicii]